jgi:hypothetical protein
LTACAANSTSRQLPRRRTPPAAAFDVATRVLTGIGSLEALPGELAGLNASTDHPFRRNNGLSALLRRLNSGKDDLA